MLNNFFYKSRLGWPKRMWRSNPLITSTVYEEGALPTKSSFSIAWGAKTRKIKKQNKQSHLLRRTSEPCHFEFLSLSLKSAMVSSCTCPNRLSPPPCIFVSKVKTYFSETMISSHTHSQYCICLFFDQFPKSAWKLFKKRKEKGRWLWYIWIGVVPASSG